METTINEYEKQAQDFLTKTNTSLTVTFLKQAKYFEDDKFERDIYTVTLLRGNRHFTFTFGNSYNNSGRFWKYGDYKKGISQGVKSSIKGIYKPPMGFNEWDKNQNFQIPSAYDILSALQKYDVDTFENFCSEFGYDTDSRKAEKTYNAVKNEYTQLITLFNDTEMDELNEIQ